MKKIMISLMMVVAVTTISFAKSNNIDVANAVKSVAEQVKQAPFGTVYGVVENTKHHIIVATPFGKYTIEKKDGGISFMGISAKLVSSKNEPTLKSKACLKCLYFTKIISALCCYLEYFSYLYTIN